MLHHLYVVDSSDSPPMWHQETSCLLVSHWRWIWGIHHIQVVKHASERIRPGLSNLGQTLPKVWNGVPVAPENGLMSSNFFCKRRIYCICDCNLEGINSSIPLLGSCGAICVTVMPKKQGKIQEILTPSECGQPCSLIVYFGVVLWIVLFGDSTTFN